MRRKIVFYIAGLQRGGAERVIANLANYFDQQNYQVTMFTDCILEKEYELNSGIKREVVGYEPTGKRVADMVKRVTVIRTAYQKIRPDVVVSFIGKTNIRAILASFGTGIPVIVSVRSTPQREYRSKAMKLLARILFCHAAGVVFQTEGAKQWFGKRIQKKSVILSNPLQEDAVKPCYEGERANEIVTVGRCEKVKNQKLLVEAFLKIAEEFPDTVLKIYGDGAEREALERYAKGQPGGERVLFMGDCDGIPDLIYHSRIFALSSNQEGMPNALMEAMALGLSVVSTDCPCGGPATIIRDEENGLLVPVGDADAMAEAFRKILGNPSFEEKLRKNAAKLGQELAPEKVNREWMEYIESVS